MLQTVSGRVQVGGMVPPTLFLGALALQFLIRGVRIEHRGCHDGNGEPSPCWVWTRYTDPDGYPRVKLRGTDYRTHRVSYAVFTGDNDLDGFDVHHQCGVRCCINPHHLEKRKSWEHRVGEGDLPF